MGFEIKELIHGKHSKVFMIGGVIVVVLAFIAYRKRTTTAAPTATPTDTSTPQASTYTTGSDSGGSSSATDTASLQLIQSLQKSFEDTMKANQDTATKNQDVFTSQLSNLQNSTSTMFQNLQASTAASLQQQQNSFNTQQAGLTAQLQTVMQQQQAAQTAATAAAQAAEAAWHPADSFFNITAPAALPSSGGSSRSSSSSSSYNRDYSGTASSQGYATSVVNGAKVTGNYVGQDSNTRVAYIPGGVGTTVVNKDTALPAGSYYI